MLMLTLMQAVGLMQCLARWRRLAEYRQRKTSIPSMGHEMMDQVQKFRVHSMEHEV